MIDYSPPENLELEKNILGCILMSPETFYSAINVLNTDTFYNEKNKAVFDAITSIIEIGKKLNIISCFEVLRKSKHKFEAFEIVQLQSEISIVNSKEFIEKCLKLKEYQIQREIMTYAINLQQKVASNVDIDELLTYADKSITSIFDSTIVNEQTKHIKQVTDESIKNMQARIKNYASGVMSGITTGIKELDKITTGWKTGLIILAARPAVGKTAFALKFVRSSAENNNAVAIFSLEMQNTSLADRILVGFSGVDANRFRSGQLDAGEIISVEYAKKDIDNLPIYIDDKPTVGLRYIRSVVRKLKKQGKCKLVVIDYLQLIHVESGSKGQSREQEVAKITRGLKLLSKEMDLPIILLCQLSRKVEERGDKMPILSDLRESGAIEQDADMVIFIHRPELYDKENEDLKGKSMLIVAKQRDGATGDIACKHNKSLTKINDFDEVEEYASNEFDFKQVENEFF